MVKAEFDLLKDEDNVFKLYGRALIKTSVEDAKDNVEKRIEYINLEM